MRMQRPLPLLSWREAGTQLARNSASATRHMIPNMLDNSRVLRNNAFIVGSLILVGSRVIVSNMSALKAKDTPEGPYRYQEAMRTTLREIGGWTLSYAVLRQIQSLVSIGMKALFGIKVADPSVPPSYFSQIFKNIKAFTERQPLDEPIRWLESADTGKFTYESNKASRVAIDLLRKIPGLAQKEAQTLMAGTYSWLPIIIGSLFSIIASGFILEAVTRDKSDQVISSVSRMFHRKQNTAPATPSLPASTPPVNNINTSAPNLFQSVQPSTSPFSLQG